MILTTRNGDDWGAKLPELLWTREGWRLETRRKCSVDCVLKNGEDRCLVRDGWNRARSLALMEPKVWDLC